MIPTSVTHIDQRYIEGLLANNGKVIREIYTRFSAKVERYIVNNSGSEQDAGDIFQEALTAIYEQARYKQLQLTCPFEPFLLMICKRKWLNELKKRSHNPVTKPSEDVFNNIGEDVFAMAEQLEQQEEKSQLFLQLFQKLGDKCQEIIRHSLKGEHQEKVAEALGVTYGYLRKKKSECLATLMKMIQSHSQH
jgi:RNA polymerase sigma factor (sigma-70 family)